MPAARKIVLDTIEHHPLHKAWRELAEKLAEELGVELEVRIEDYVYAINHGETDELGMTWLPQLFVGLDNGEVQLVLSKYPFDPSTAKPDPEKALEEARARLREILG